MKILLIFSLCLISDGGASMEVTGYSGGGIYIWCKYDSGYKQNKKYFCKDSGSSCDVQIKTALKHQWVHTGRFSLYDNTNLAAFIVWIRELTVEDSGTYYCGVASFWIGDIYTPVRVIVKEAGALSSREVTAYAGGGINIKYRYDHKYTPNFKSFCKVFPNHLCFNGIKPDPNIEWKHDGRLSVHDNSSAGFISVIIRELITEDTGTYRCTVTVSHLIMTYTEVKLNVREDLTYGKIINKTVLGGENTNFTCEYPESHRSDPKFLCKTQTTDVCVYNRSVNEERIQIEQKFSLHDDRANQILSVSIKEVREQDSGEYWCGAEADWESDHGYKVYITQIKLTVPAFPASTLITVSVSLVGLLIGISFFIVILMRRHKKQGSETVTQSSRETNNDYENVQSVIPLQSRENTNQLESVYQSLNPNTIQSDSVYQTLIRSPNQRV